MAYQVKIDIFEGPLDLLLHLIQKNDLDIYDIPISRITEEYLSYLDLLKELNLTVAGDFLVMASTLIQIKAKTLLPADETNEEGEGPDPRSELVNRLLEYQKFKEASRILGEKYERQKDVYFKGAPIFNKDDQVLEVDLSKLLEAFQTVLETADTSVRDVMVEELPVEVRIREVLDILEKKEYVRFGELFEKGASRPMLVVTFMALLELIRLKQVRVTQTDNFGEIHINRVQETEEAQPEAPVPVQ